MEKLSELEKLRRQALRDETGAEDAAGVPEDARKILAAYTSWVDSARKKAAEALDQIDRETAYETYCLKREQDKSRASSVNGERRSTAASRAHAARIQALADKKEQLCRTDPDYFCAAGMGTLLADLADERDGRLVTVPYLARAKKQAQDSLEAGIPVYFVGHLGSGKTQLAVECAVDRMRERRRQELLDQAMEAFRTRGGKEEDEKAYFLSVYPGIVRQVSSEELHPYFIAGSHNLTAEDMFFEKTLKLSHASGTGSNEEQLNTLIQGFMSFVRENEEKMQDMTGQQQLELMLAGWKTFSNLYIAENSGYGTTVDRIEKEVLLALREGKPVIIDEINTIAMANLIALNDILQHHAGQTAYITGVGSLTIREGFCLIGTGNLSTGTVSYEGTNVLNPAFQSRFTTIVYNYVPQAEEGDPGSEETAGKRELYRLIIEHLCEPDGSLYLPDPPEALAKLWRLAQLARVSQDIFEGHTGQPGNGGDTPVLNEAVLSVRGIMHVLDHWNRGEEEDLSMALWNGFLSSVTNPDDRNLLLALAVRYGFFPDAEGWHITSRGRGDAPMEYDDIRTAPYRHHLLPLKKLSPEDVVYLLFGNGPERRSLPKELEADIQVDRDAGRNLDLVLSLDASLTDLEQGAELLADVAEDSGDAGDAGHDS